MIEKGIEGNTIKIQGEREVEAGPTLGQENGKGEGEDEDNVPLISHMPITVDGQIPQKRFYRTRAHCNPLSHNECFEYPRRPRDYDWVHKHYPTFPLTALDPTPVDSVRSMSLKMEEIEEMGERREMSEIEGMEEGKKIVFPIDFIDVGCGFGGLTIALAKLFPEKVVLALEIREKVAEYVRLRIEALRAGTISEDNLRDYQSCEELFGVKRKRQELGGENKKEEDQSEKLEEEEGSTQEKKRAKIIGNAIGNNVGMNLEEEECATSILNKDKEGYNKITSCHNASCMKANVMKYLNRYIERGQLSKLFFCFPDPHFKAKNHRRRIISTILLPEYAYFLKPGGYIYAITDCKELHDWHVDHLEASTCFERVHISCRNIVEGEITNIFKPGYLEEQEKNKYDFVKKLKRKQTTGYTHAYSGNYVRINNTIVKTLNKDQGGQKQVENQNQNEDKKENGEIIGEQAPQQEEEQQPGGGGDGVSNQNHGETKDSVANGKLQGNGQGKGEQDAVSSLEGQQFFVSYADKTKKIEHENFPPKNEKPNDTKNTTANNNRNNNNKESKKAEQKRIASLIEYEHPDCGKENSPYDYDDGTIELVYQATEEGQKVDRNNGAKYLCIYRRRTDAEIQQFHSLPIQKDKNVYNATFNQSH